jgi:hypothetical protein
MAVLERPAADAAPRMFAAQAGWATYPALARDGAGTVWAAWLERQSGADALSVAQVGAIGTGGTGGASGSGFGSTTPGSVTTWHGGAPGVRRLARASAIKDGPSLAWSAETGLTCAWQYREPGGSADGVQVWRLAVATHVESGAERSPLLAPDDLVSDGRPRRPSHPVLASDGQSLALAYELHGPAGADVVVRLHRDGVWSDAVALTGLHAKESGAPEAAYQPALAFGPDGALWAAWIEARDGGFGVWTSHAPASAAAVSAGWSAPERVSGGPHLPDAPRVLATRRGVWVAWTNCSGGPHPEKLEPWADGPERRWERLPHTQRRRLHVRRLDTASGSWGPEWRELEPPERGIAGSHFPVLLDLGHQGGGAVGTGVGGTGVGDGESVALVCRRTVARALGWSVEVYRLRAAAGGRIYWSEPASLTTGVAPAAAGARQATVDTSGVTEGTNMPVAAASAPGGATVLAWQRHDRRRTARGFHLTPGASAIVVTERDLLRALPEATREPVAVAPAHAAPQRIRARPAPRSVTIDGEQYRLVFGNLHRHAESSLCGIDFNGGAEFHMRHAPNVNRSEFLSITDHGEHLNDADWREQCLLADFYTWPGSRAAFPGIEWTSEAPWQPAGHGHKNVIFSRSDLPFVDCWMPHSDTPQHLWDWLREHDPIAVTIPHHTMRGKTPTFWDDVDADFQPVVELFQDRRGSAEWLGAPAATSTVRVQGLAIDPRGSLRRALDKGLKVGLIASGDHGGVALAGVYVKEVSRAGILEGLRARRCFATTGDRLLLDFRINGVFQGGEVTLTEVPRGPENTAAPLRVALRAEVLRTVRRVVLVRDGVEIETFTPDPAARTVERTWEAEAPFIGTSYFYVRIEGEDGELAWSSPVWASMDWSAQEVREPW